MTLPLFKNKAYVMFMSGQFVSALGGPFTMIALSWFVYSITGSTLALGSVLLANAIPLAVLRLFAGTLVDRWDRKKTMFIIDILRALILFVPVMLYYVDALQIWHLILANILLGSCEAFFRPAAFAIIPNIVDKEQLVKANGLMNAFLNGSMLIGPALAGVVIAIFSAPFALLINAITFTMSAMTLLFLPANRADNSAEKHFIKELVAGFTFFKTYTGLLWLLCLAAISNTGMGVILIMIVPYAMDVLQVGSEGYGMMQTAVGIGFIIGSIFATFLKRFPRRSIMLIAHIIGGSFLILLVFFNAFVMTLAIIVGYGLSIAIWNTYSTTTYQELVPDQLRGRVQSVRLLIAQGTTPIGMAIGAAIGHLVNITTVFGIIGIAIILSGLIAFFIPTIRIVNTTGTGKIDTMPHKETATV